MISFGKVCIRRGDYGGNSVMSVSGKSGYIQIISLFAVCSILVFAPRVTLDLITGYVVTVPDASLPEVEEGTEEIISGWKVSNHEGVLVSTKPYISCVWKDPDSDDGYKVCEAIFELEGKGGSPQFLNSPQVTLSFQNDENIRNLDILYSQDFYVEEEIHNDFTEELVSVSDVSLSVPLLITGHAVGVRDKGSGESRGIVKREVDGLSRSSLKHIKDPLKKRKFINFFSVDTFEEIAVREEVIEETLDTGPVQNDSSPSTSNNSAPSNSSIGENNSSTTSNSSELIDPTPTLSNENETSNASNNIIEEVILEENNLEEDPSQDSSESNQEGFETLEILTGYFLRYLGPSDAIDISRPFAVKVTFEIPKGEQNSFDFELNDNGYAARIDPDVSGCGVLNSSNARYVLTSDYSASGTCFTIEASNVTLDCQGKTITYSTAEAGSGVYSEQDDTTIQNCNLVEGNESIAYGYGIYISGGNNAVIYNNTLSSFAPAGSGIFLEESSYNQIKQNNISSASGTYGIYLSPESSNSDIFLNTISTLGVGAFGISIEGDSNENNITENAISTSDESSHGVSIISASSNEITRNSFLIAGNDVAAIYVEDSPETTVAENVILLSNVDSYGVSLFASNESIVSKNNISIGGVASLGILVEYGGQSTIEDNHLISNQREGMGIAISYSSTNTDIIGNTINITAEGGYGVILEENSKNTVLQDNEFHYRGNDGFGAYLDSTSSNQVVNANFVTQGENTPAIYFSEGVSGTSISNSFFSTNGTNAAALYIYGSENYLKCTSCYFSLGSTELYVNSLVEEGQWNFTNASDLSSIFWSSSAIGELNSLKYLNVSAVYENGSAISGASISIFDTFGTLVFSGTTNAAGMISRNEFIEFSQSNATNRIEYSNYTCNVSYSGQSAGVSVNISIDDSAIIYLEELGDFVENSPSNPSSGEGGSGGGGGGHSEDPCKRTKWACTPWSSCTEGTKTRDCTPANELCKDSEFAPRDTVACGKNKKSLFDIGLELLNGVTSDGTLLANIKLINIGSEGKVTAELYYEIERNGEIVLVERESIPVETQTEFLKEFDVSNLGNGEYILRASLSYEDQIEPAESQAPFSIGNTATSSSQMWGVYVTTGILLMSLVYLFFRMKRT